VNHHHFPFLFPLHRSKHLHPAATYQQLQMQRNSELVQVRDGDQRNENVCSAAEDDKQQQPKGQKGSSDGTRKKISRIALLALSSNDSVRLEEVAVS
jgi:hypothetical protein